MKRSIFLSILLICATLFPLDALAELDLAKDARFDSSGNLADSVNDNYAVTGFEALTDDDEFTLWIPSKSPKTYLEIDLKPDALDSQISLESIIIEWGEDFPESIMVTAGPDSYTQTVLANTTISDPDTLTITQPGSIDKLRKIRLIFSTSKVSIKKLSISASKAKAVSPAPVITGEMQDDLYLISFSKSENAHHYEIERDRYGELSLFTSYSNSFSDLPHQTFSDSYRVRAIDFSGNTSGWSNSVTNSVNSTTHANAVKIRGVAEAFEGYPYSNKKRYYLLRWLGNWQLNHFFYAPLYDAKRKDDWRSLYSESELAKIADSLTVAKRHDITFVYCISPGKDLKPTLADDLDTIKTRFEQLLNIGVESFAIFLDDSEATVNSGLGENHAMFVNAVYDWLQLQNPASTLFLKSVIYTGTEDDFNSEQKAYLEKLSEINQSIPVIWTGADEYNTEITSAELTDFSSLVNHPILLWDNYPYNTNEQHYLNHHPVTNLSKDLLTNENLAGVSCSAMSEAVASLFAIQSYSSILLNPENYDPEDNFAEKAGHAIDPEIDKADWAMLQGLLSENSLFTESRENDLTSLIPEFINNIKIGEEEDIAQSALSLFESIIDYHSLLDRISGSKNEMFNEEIKPYFDKLHNYLSAISLAINILQAKAYGQSDSFYSEQNKLLELVSLIEASDYNTSDGTFNEIMDLASSGTETSFENRFTESIFIQPIITDSNEFIREQQDYYWDLGVNISPSATWEIIHDNTFSTTLYRHLLNLKATDQTNNSAFSTHRLGVVSHQDNVTIVKEATFELCPILAENDSNDLPVSSTLESKNEVSYLVQNDIIVGDIAFSQYSRLDLSGSFKKMRATLDHNLSFKYRDQATIKLLEAESQAAILPEFNDSNWEDAFLPSVENTMCFTGDQSGPEMYFEGVWYRKKVEVPQGGKDIRLVIEGSGYITDVWADGLYLGYHEAGYTPFYLPLPEDLAKKDNITLTIRVDNPVFNATESMPFAARYTEDNFTLSFHPYTGITGDIYWQFLPSTQNVSISYLRVIPTSKSGKASLELAIKNLSSNPVSGNLKIKAYKLDSESEFYLSDTPLTSVLGTESPVSGDKSTDITIGADSIQTYKLDISVSGAKSWSFSFPNLYAIRATISDNNGNVLDQSYQQTGFRTVETTEDNKIKLNSSYTYLPAVSYYQDSYKSGTFTNWTETLNDLRKIKELGARLIITGGFPHQSKTYTLADRLGLLVVCQMPFISFDTNIYNAQSIRPVALNLFREAVFSHANHPSIVFWNVCSNCQSSSGEFTFDSFLETINDDITANYPDNRLTMISMDYDSLEDNLPKPSNYDLLNLVANDSTDTSDLADFLSNYTNIYETKSLFITTGKSSGYSDTLLKEQSLLANSIWETTFEYATISATGALQKDGFLTGIAWDSMFDHYSLDTSKKSCGTVDIDRFSTKPIFEALQKLYGQYPNSSASSENDTSTFIPNKVDSAGTCSEPASNPWPFWLCVLALLILRKKRFPKSC